MSGREKYLRDAALLEEHLKEHPGHPRSQFYLAQSYKDAGEHEQAYVEYKKRVQMEDGWDEEKYVAQLEAGRMAVALDQPEEVVLREYLDAFELRPTRAEPLHNLARYFRFQQRYGKAFVFARTGADIPRPDDSLFVTQEVYDWRMLDELAVAAYWVGDYVSVKEACEAILQSVENGLDVPTEDVERIKGNLDWAMKKLAG